MVHHGQCDLGLSTLRIHVMSQCSACHVCQNTSNSLPVMSPPYRMVPWQWCELQDWREVGSPRREWPADELHVSWEWKGRIQVWPPYVILMVSRHLSTLTFLTEPKHSFTGWACQSCGWEITSMLPKWVMDRILCPSTLVPSQPEHFDHLQWSVISRLSFWNMNSILLSGLLHWGFETSLYDSPKLMRLGLCSDKSMAGESTWTCMIDCSWSYNCFWFVPMCRWSNVLWRREDLPRRRTMAERVSWSHLLLHMFRRPAGKTGAV